MIYTGYDNGEIVSWSLKNCEIVDNLIGHSDKVNILKQCSNRVIMSTSNDK